VPRLGIKGVTPQFLPMPPCLAPFTVKAVPVVIIFQNWRCCRSHLKQVRGSTTLLQPTVGRYRKYGKPGITAIDITSISSVIKIRAAFLYFKFADGQTNAISSQSLCFTHTEQLIDYLITDTMFLWQTCVSRKRM